NMPATTAGMNAIPEAQVAQGSAMNNIIRQITASFGIVFFSIYYGVRRAKVFRTHAHLSMQEATLLALNEAFMIAGIFILLIVPFGFLLKGQKELDQDIVQKRAEKWNVASLSSIIFYGFFLI